MRILQFFLPGKGRRIGLLDADERVIDITTGEISSVLKLILTAEREKVSINVIAAELEEEVAAERAGREYSFSELNVSPSENSPHLLIPIEPPEVWGCGVTYLRSAESRDKETETDLYTKVYSAERPEIFFKATASRCVGPNEPIHIRSDSNDTVPEPELAYILDSRGRIIGFTIANDVSARDIEGENPLYLSQAKIFKGCCALGPIIVTPSEITDLMDLNIRCRVIRDEVLIYEGETNTSQMKRSFEEINRFLMRDNPIPTGTVVLTGTGVVLPDDLSLEDGDIVEIEIDEIGVLSNPVRKLGG